MHICGVDEAGRGPLAGSVYAAAVILDSNNPIAGLKDSKKLSSSKRDSLFIEIKQKALAYAIAYATVEEIDRLNILQATLLAMKRSIQALAVQPQLVLIDGIHAPKIEITTQTIIKGDAKIAAISAASILAKVARDLNMLEMDQKYPQYGFKQHKGYGTKSHIAAINEYGILPIHRKSFAPIRDAATINQLFN
ncbi:MAG: hypothetical protein RL017_860 [Pseudomonadota bacterium]|jgi:ribonuclease HII|nr:ribonuclease HII [Burkholderiales bacterium]